MEVKESETIEKYIKYNTKLEIVSKEFNEVTQDLLSSRKQSISAALIQEEEEKNSAMSMKEEKKQQLLQMENPADKDLVFLVQGRLADRRKELETVEIMMMQVAEATRLIAEEVESHSHRLENILDNVRHAAKYTKAATDQIGITSDTVSRRNHV